LFKKSRTQVVYMLAISIMVGIVVGIPQLIARWPDLSKFARILCGSLILFGFVLMALIVFFALRKQVGPRYTGGQA